MYVPKKHQAKDEEAVYEYIRNHGFATLISTGDAGVEATHIPLYLIKRGEKHYLWGHIAAANPQRKAIEKGNELLAIFMDTHSYVSSSWYGHVNVPTWNYISVHVYGRPSIFSSEQLVDSMRLLVGQYEEGRPGRFRLEDMSSEELGAHLAGVVGFEISMDRVESAYKLSQNRNDEDFKSIVGHLKEAKGATETASEMIKLRQDLF